MRADEVAAAEIGWRKRDRDLATEQEGRPVAEVERLGDVVIRDQDGGALIVGEAAQARGDARGPVRVDRGEGLVAEQDARAGAHRARELSATHHP